MEKVGAALLSSVLACATAIYVAGPRLHARCRRCMPRLPLTLRCKTGRPASRRQWCLWDEYRDGAGWVAWLGAWWGGWSAWWGRAGPSSRIANVGPAPALTHGPLCADLVHLSNDGRANHHHGDCCAPGMVGLRVGCQLAAGAHGQERGATEGRLWMRLLTRPHARRFQLIGPEWSQRETLSLDDSEAAGGGEAEPWIEGAVAVVSQVPYCLR